jgi:hypothetical protein
LDVRLFNVVPLAAVETARGGESVVVVVPQRHCRLVTGSGLRALVARRCDHRREPSSACWHSGRSTCGCQARVGW